MRIHDVFHVSLLKPYRSDGSVQPPPLPKVINGELDYEVEAVLAHWEKKGRGRQVKREYLVKWVGDEDINNTWEPEDNLEHAREALQAY
jgi:Chromo (CHRromatin Organisation MOdifier) domain